MSAYAANADAVRHVERLIESFAYLAARVQRNIDAEFPKLVEALFSVLYPQLANPLPAMAISRFDIDTTKGQSAAGVKALWSPLGALAPQAPAIAVVDSGIDGSKTADFGARVIAHADFVGDGTSGDPEGHGTMVAAVDPAIRAKVRDRLRLALNPERLHFFDGRSEAAI